MPVALITGANRGLGLAFTRQYLADGWQVFATCRNPASANELQRLAQKTGGRLAIVAMDVTDAQSVRAAAAQMGDKSAEERVAGFLLEMAERESS